MTDNFLPELPAGAFDKQDAGDDLAFYAPARLVTHIDAGAIAALTGFYRAALPNGSRVLDLMSSWISHLPDNREYAEIVGHGMNADELDEGTFDAALCCVGAQYLERLVAVFADVRRVLVAGAPFVVSFSNRCFPTKAVAIWRSLDTNGHAALVQLYLQRAGFAEVALEVLADGRASDPLIAVIGRA